MNRKMVMITTAWCAPCKHAKKYLIPEVEKDCPGQVEVVDGADDPENLAKKNKVQHVPTILLMEDGKTVKMFSGVLPQAGVLVNWLKGGELHGADRCDG
jgi:thioredoxin-like negative regulator of GroEL